MHYTLVTLPWLLQQQIIWFCAYILQYICHSAEHTNAAIKDFSSTTTLLPAWQAEVGVFSSGAARGWHQQSVQQGLPRALVPRPCHCFTAACLSIKGPLYYQAFHRANFLGFSNLALFVSESGHCHSTQGSCCHAGCSHATSCPPCELMSPQRRLKFVDKGGFCESFLACIIWCCCTLKAGPSSLLHGQDGGCGCHCLTVEWSPPNSH